MLSWNEIKSRAISFSRDWKHGASERSDSQEFWVDFLNIFGIRRRTVASFEEAVQKLSGRDGRIDMFWPGRLLVEQKSAGQDLDKAHSQGMGYIRGLVDSGREKEVPRWLIVSDFQRIALHDLEPEQDPDLPLLKRQAPSVTFPLSDLHKHIRRFAFIPGYKQQKLNPEDPANIEATEIMASLHDALHAGGFAGHDLRVLLVRLLFCLFADDTGIFNQQDFKLFLENRTAIDGSDTGPKLARLFDVLNTPEDQRQANLDEDLAAFPYINGALFAERISFADFNTLMRGKLLKACSFEWARISPAVFGSLFQGVMDATERRQIGAHYTAEKNILKLIRPLFLDELRAEFDAARQDKSTRRIARLEALHKRMATLTFFDPACGCGNFLVITYRELRQLELEILLEIHRNELNETQHEFSFDVTKLSKVDVDQMYGIELEEFPARIAEVALWLADHQANIALSEAFGQLYRRIPLKKSPHIFCANALQTDWKAVIAPEKCSYILGNPPFVGHHYQGAEQKEDQRRIMANISAAGVIDFVANWHILAAQYIQGTKVVAAFVSTNSICQGEQAGLLWSELFGRYQVKIHFAHRTFAWESEARGKAHVHCVIVGFANYDIELKTIYEYESDPNIPTISNCRNISAYLVSGSDTCLINRSNPICGVPPMRWGSKATDGGNLIFTDAEKILFLQEEPSAQKFMRYYYSAEDFIHGQFRWCLWLHNASPNEINQLPLVKQRVEAVKNFRLASKAEATRNYAKYPTLFRQIAQPDTDYLLIPRVSSERRPYIPTGFMSAEAIAGDVQLIANATFFHFGILTSNMHMAWVRQVSGRLKSDFRYGKDIVYNNFPWPMHATEAQRTRVEEAAQAVLAAREKFPASTLADLYDPVTMPPVLAKAHEALDRAVDRCYRKEPFTSDRQRVEYLFALYEQLTAPLAVEKKSKKRGS